MLKQGAAVKRILDAGRERRLPATYSWVDHRLMRGGFLRDLDVQSIALYFFLVLVGDHRGLSYYGDRTICRTLSLSYEDLYGSRMRLINQELIAYDPPLYQVLEVPAGPVYCHTPSRDGRAALGEILARMAQGARKGEA